MKRILLLLLSFCIYSTATAQSGFGSADYLNTKYGFQEATFESPVGSFTNLVPVSSIGIHKVYKRKSSSVIGKYKAGAPVYTFYNNKLCEIQVEVEGAQNVEGVLDALSIAYGIPSENKGLAEWTSSRVYMRYKQNEAKTKATLSIYSNYLKSQDLDYLKQQALNKIDRQVDQRVKEAAKAATDL